MLKIGWLAWGVQRMNSEEQMPDSGDNSGKPAAGQRRGRPFPKGTSGNPRGRPKSGAGGPEVPPEPDDGVVDAPKLRKVLGQDKSADVGPTERALRRFLEKDTKGYLAELERRDGRDRREVELEARVKAADTRERELAAEVGRLGQELAEARGRGQDGPLDDPQTEAALGLIEKLLLEAGDAQPR